jgi:hypothetical protein
MSLLEEEQKFQGWRRPPAGIPLSGRVPGRAPGSSRSHDDDDDGLQYVLRKIDPSFRFFL